jgi:uncharacterized coiled-coil DUF342 family protein
MKILPSDNTELLNFLIEENARLNNRLSLISKANKRKYKQLKKYERGLNKLKKELALCHFELEEASRSYNAISDELDYVNTEYLNNRKKLTDIQQELNALKKQKTPNYGKIVKVFILIVLSIVAMLLII